MLNLTPHAIVVMNEAKEVVATFEASGTTARLINEFSSAQDYFGIPVSVTKVIGMENVPAADEMKPFLVSSMVLDALGPEYHGIAFAPDTGPSSVRNEKGHIIGVTRLRTVSK